MGPVTVYEICLDSLMDRDAAWVISYYKDIPGLGFPRITLGIEKRGSAVVIYKLYTTVQDGNCIVIYRMMPKKATYCTYLILSNFTSWISCF